MTDVPTPATLVNDAPRRFGAVVEAELARRHVAALGRAEGRVLDLAEPTARAELAAAIDRRATGGRYDTVVSIGELVRFPDLAAALGAIDGLLAPDGRLLAVEPVAVPGTLALFVSAPFTALPALRGFQLGRDLPAALRTTPLVADDIERFTLRTQLRPVRHFIAITARRARPADGDTAEPIDTEVGA